MSNASEATPAPQVRIPVGWYVAALALYLVIAYFTKTVLLNWVMGPLFLLLTLYLVPTAAAVVRRRLTARSRP
ncbi:hypothetical protein [Phytoactinopolyspora halotolerans]|uniref:Uncharacterized protein n=1 Tax=Phytoactinopolyspora halotolerans TaxID=1981512 RepID=A0A6L9S494_9ACTN|nr:hypothetical protein [Phytoactinopolyspora halotolerans]NEE00285.1 hypothetical protein [Phytoactinopolyspora halotolerans]